MNQGLAVIVALLLSACASTGPTAFNAEQQLQLQHIIHNVARRQQVGLSGDASNRGQQAIFRAGFTMATTSLLSDPGLMPALMTAQSRTVELVISVAPGPAQLQELSHAMQLSLQLQQFLQDQQFQVSRRLQANATRSEIALQPAEDGV